MDEARPYRTPHAELLDEVDDDLDGIGLEAEGRIAGWVAAKAAQGQIIPPPRRDGTSCAELRIVWRQRADAPKRAIALPASPTEGHNPSMQKGPALKQGRLARQAEAG